MTGTTGDESVAERPRPFGWALAHDVPALPATMPGGRPWPRISIVTPTYNQGHYIEETIASVAGQNYPDLEHIVIDGGSTDATVEILRRHDRQLAYWVSEKDRGQSHAINKGMARATGEILTWLNSDDLLAPGALAAIAMAFARSGADMVAGICEIHRDGALQARHLTACHDGPLPLDDLLDLEGGWNAGQFFYQPEVMFTRSLWERAGGRVEEHLFYSMDYDLWVRFAECGAKLHVIGRAVALFRQHDEQKTHVAAQFKAELAHYRAAYVARTRHVAGPRRASPQFGRSLRILFLNDHGWKYGAGIAHARLAAACILAGHTVVAVALAGSHDLPLTVEGVFEEVAAVAPDIILVGNLHGAGIEAGAIGRLAGRWPTFAFLHDLWWVTGRCAYTAGCDKLVRGCDASCPTPDEYPAMPPARIHDAWLDKRTVLGETGRPVLLGMSQWSQRTALDALATGDERRVEKVVLGLPVDQFRPHDKRACRERFGLPLDKFLVLCTATNLKDRRKGVDRVAALIAETPEPDIVFVTVGHGSFDLEAGADRVISIPYQGEPEEVARLYAAVDIILAPSREETLGQIYIEGAACGTPSIAFATTGIADAVLDGTTGFAGREETAAERRRLLMRARDDGRHLDDLRRWARIHAESEWSLEASYRSLFGVLRRHGIVDRFELPHKIGFAAAATCPAVAFPMESQVSWSPEFGVEHEEGPFPEYGITTRFRWLLGPTCQIVLHTAVTGVHVLTFRLQNRMFDTQGLRLSIDGTTFLEAELPRRDLQDFDRLVVEVALTQGLHRLTMAFSQAFVDTSLRGRKLALRLESFGIHLLRLKSTAEAVEAQTELAR